MATQAPKTPCEMWDHLLRGKIPYGDAPYTADFYYDFVSDRDNLVDHLYGCSQCQKRLIGLVPATWKDSLKQMPFDDFRTAIGQLRDKAIARWRNATAKTP